KPLGGQTSVVTAFGENDRATWTSPKKSAAIVKNSMTESAALLTLPIAGIFSWSTPEFAITELCDGEGKKPTHIYARFSASGGGVAKMCQST
ncbi:MAG: hypothetical protein WB019_02295, partial [Pseudolabrys sp.]